MAKKFIGCQYPIFRSPRGLLAQKNGVDQIKADLLQLLLTNPGERVMLPEYGTPLRKLIFEQNDAVLIATARNMISLSVSNWEPRVQIKDIEVGAIRREDLPDIDPGYEMQAILKIRISFYDPGQIDVVYDIELETPLGG